MIYDFFITSRSKNDDRMFPQFLCIGAQKAGTTWLHDNLSKQPQIWLPPVKEIHFLDHPEPSLFQLLFSRRSHHKLARANAMATAYGMISSRSKFSDLAYAVKFAYMPRSWEWYASLFPDDPERLCGEICPGYARLQRETIAAVVHHNPRIKVIYLLRDPIDRAWSALAMHFRKRPGSSVVDDSAKDIIVRLKTSKSFGHCQYERNIDAWLEHLPSDRIYFGFFDRIREDPSGYLAEILRFLEISDEVESHSAHIMVNASLGEKISPEIERDIARLLKNEAASLHRRFANPYTERWLAHAEAAADSSAI